MMKTTSSLILAIFFATSFITSTNAQNDYRDFKIRDTVKDENFTIFNMNDFRDALVQLGINVYKWDMPIPRDNDYQLEFYVQEYEKAKLIKDSVVRTWTTKFWGFDENSRAEFQYIKNLRIISEMPDFNDKSDKLRLKVSLNSGKFQFTTSILPRPIYECYYLIKFEETNFEIGKDIPLLLFNAGWEINFEGELVRQYCGPNFIPADLDDDSLRQSDHFFVFGYRVVDEEFYRRD
ncbi:DUF5041 domain-containing protein [Maribellus luteus]|uniref:DUF5041 domain-containing protein n=1 Tax=Maribellus luteus TaxID=2305463 RepID=A0A399SVF5_9BACT|nr:DUF5041 domain-containing protein [Maribellus luteus]RIJ47408.1 DUF5041 domain-containing protein [Maribellus luteus]